MSFSGYNSSIWSTFSFGDAGNCNFNRAAPYIDNETDQAKDGEPLYCICRTSDTNRFMIGCDSCNEWYHGDCISITEEYAKNIKHFYCLICRDRNPSLEIQFKEKKPDKKEKHVEKSHSSIAIDHRSQKYDDGSRKMKRCGQCVNCYLEEDCGRCDYCKDMRKFGGPNKIKQKCRQRQCMNFGLVLGRKPKESPSKEELNNHFSRTTPLAPLQQSNDEDDDDEQDEDFIPYTSRSRTTTPSRQQRRAKRQVERRSRKTEHRKKHPQRGSARYKEPNYPKQCLGPACINPAKNGSKYCSDDCGMKLATNRVFEILPMRSKEFDRANSVADQNNRKSLDKIRRDLQECKEQMDALNRKQEMLVTLIDKAKQTPVADDEEMLDGDLEDTEASTYCITCGHEVSSKNAFKHMEKCFNKYESQTSFGSFYQTNIEGTNIFCDYYSAQQRTYCKRLKILCPEHLKEPKVGEDEVCGCPLGSNIYSPSVEFCRILKKTCLKHHQWEKFRRAEIDLDKMRVLFKSDDLLEQDRSIRQQMANRGGVLALMLHQTINHDRKPTSNI